MIQNKVIVLLHIDIEFWRFAEISRLISTYHHHLLIRSITSAVLSLAMFLAQINWFFLQIFSLSLVNSLLKVYVLLAAMIHICVRMCPFSDRWQICTPPTNLRMTIRFWFKSEKSDPPPSPLLRNLHRVLFWQILRMTSLGFNWRTCFMRRADWILAILAARQSLCSGSRKHRCCHFIGGIQYCVIIEKYI